MPVRYPAQTDEGRRFQGAVDRVARAAIDRHVAANAARAWTAVRRAVNYGPGTWRKWASGTQPAPLWIYVLLDDLARDPHRLTWRSPVRQPPEDAGEDAGWIWLLATVIQLPGPDADESWGLPTANSLIRHISSETPDDDNSYEHQILRAAR